MMPVMCQVYSSLMLTAVIVYSCCSVTSQAGDLAPFLKKLMKEEDLLQMH